jgi:hypothetical protein
VVDLIHLDVERECDVVADYLEPRFARQLADVPPGTGVVVVDDQHLVPGGEQAPAQV